MVIRSLGNAADSGTGKEAGGLEIRRRWWKMLAGDQALVSTSWTPYKDGNASSSFVGCEARLPPRS